MVLYLLSHLLGLLLHLLDDLVACAAIVAACRRAVLFPFLQADPAEIIFALRGDSGSVQTPVMLYSDSGKGFFLLNFYE